MNFADFAKSRHSVREFKPDPIPDDILTSIADAAKCAPSWCNHQPWCITIATGETLKTIREEFIKRAEAKVEVKSDVPPLHRSDVSQLSKDAMEKLFSLLGQSEAEVQQQFNSSQARLFDAPAVAFFTLPKGFSPYSALDLGAYYQTFMLAAKDKGVDTIPAYQLVIHPDVLHKALSIPDDQHIFIAVALGYAADSKLNKFVPDRIPVAEFCTIKH